MDCKSHFQIVLISFRCGQGDPIKTVKSGDIVLRSAAEYDICSICGWDRDQFLDALDEGQLNPCKSTGELDFFVTKYNSLCKSTS